MEVCYKGALEIVGQEMSTEKILTEVEKDITCYHNSSGSVTLSGGEPMEQAEFTISILRKCRENEIKTTIERPADIRVGIFFEKVKNYVDTILYDIKHIDSQECRKLTGKPNEIILKNLTILLKINLDFKLILWIPVIKPYNDQRINIIVIVNFLKV